jgi:transcription initiation factor IIF auxiliary subunit
MTISQDQLKPGSNPYNFTFSIRASPQTMSQIKFVTYYIHPTFNPSVVTRTYAENSFALSFTGWGKIDQRTKVFFKDGQVKDVRVKQAIIAANNHYAGFGPGTVNIFRNLLGLS